MPSYGKNEKIDRIDDMGFIYILSLAEVHREIVCPEGGGSVPSAEIWSEANRDLIFTIPLIWALLPILTLNLGFFDGS